MFLLHTLLSVLFAVRVVLIVTLATFALQGAPETVRMGWPRISDSNEPPQTRSVIRFPIAVMNEAGRRAGLTLEWQDVRTPADLLKGLDEGTIDIAPAALATPERQSRYYLTTPWWHDDLALVVRLDGPQTEPDLAGKRIAVRNPTMEGTARRAFPQSLILRPPSSAGTSDDAVAQVCKGEADAALMTHREADLMLGAFRPQQCAGTQLVILDTTATEGVSLMTRPDKASLAKRLRRAIDDMAEDGMLAAIAARYPGIPASSAVQLAEQDRQATRQRALWIVIAALSFVSAASAAAALYLRGLHTRLRQSNAKIEAVLDSIPEPVAVVDANGNVVKTNRVFGRDFGLHPTVGNYFDHMEAFTESGERIAPEQWPLSRMLRGETVLAFDLIVDVNGVRTNRRISGSPVYDANGNITHAVITLFDVTDQKRMAADLKASNQELRAVFELSPTAICVADCDGRLVFRNHVHRDMFPEFADAPDSTNGDTLLATGYELKTPEGAPVPPDRYPSHRALHGDRVDNERYRIHGDGMPRECLISALPLRDSEGRVHRAIISVHDISDIARAEHAMEQTERELRASNDELQAYAYTVSHDLQEPLRMVSSYVDLLESRYSHLFDVSAHEFMGVIRSAALRMTAMLGDLLKYSRAGQDRGPKLEADANEAMQEAVLFLGRKVEETGAEVTWTGLPTVKVWPGRLEQILQNLVENALKYSRTDERPHISVQASLAGDQWLFSVTDNGIGMDMRYADRIFRVFQRLHGRDEYGGTGVGLAIVRRVVERHGGRVWLDWSAPGKGSRFCFTLPAVVADEPAVE